MIHTDLSHAGRALVSALAALTRFTLMLCTLILGALTTTGAAQQPLADGGTYRLDNACTGLSLDVEDAALQNGARAIVWPYAGAANQQWTLREVSQGRYRLVGLHSGQHLDVSGAGQTSGTGVLQWSATGGAHQEWLIRDAGGGQSQLIPAHAPTLRLQVAGGGQQPGSAVQVGSVQGGGQAGCAQRWRITRVTQPARTARLAVSPGGRSLVYADGSPFLYLGDTAWELVHRLNRAEVVRYLDARRAQGFSVIQTVALAELGGPSVPNAQGDLPLQGRDPARPATTPGSDPLRAAEYDFWDHLDYVVAQAAARGLYVSLLPTWGQWVNNDPLFTTDSARHYGRFLGERYRSSPVIWMLGGDRNPDSEAQRAIWRAMASGLEEGMGSAEAALMGYHPAISSSSSQWFHTEPWLDFNVWQTGHCRDQSEWEKVSRVRELKPVKPVLNAEPMYEDHPVCFDAGKQGYSDATDVRNVAYWSVFAGAFGHTYGHHAVWQMWQQGRSGVNGPRTSWQEALKAPGAQQMRHLRTLMEARPLLGGAPDAGLVAEPLQGGQRIQAIRGDGYALVYTAAGQPIRLRPGQLPGAQTTAVWFNPRTGQTTPAGTVPRQGEPVLRPPSQGRGHDWVLVLDDAGRAHAPLDSRR